MHAKSDEAPSGAGDEPDAAVPALPEGWEAVGKGSEQVVTVEAAAAESADPEASASTSQAAEQTSTAGLVAVGILAGVYLLYTIGWLIVGLRMRELPLIPEVSFIVVFVLGVAAPALWFAASWLATRRSKTWVRLAALLAGVVLLVPWPFVTWGSLGVAA